MAIADKKNSTAEPQRKHIRLENYDYSQTGYYYVTICSNNIALFGKLSKDEMRLNEYGNIVHRCWLYLSHHYSVELDTLVIMPDHIHGIIHLDNDVGAGLKPARLKSSAKKAYKLSEIIRGFKTYSARKINEARKTIGTRVWQRNYYDRVIRNESELLNIRKYILENPMRWAIKEKQFI